MIARAYGRVIIAFSQFSNRIIKSSYCLIIASSQPTEPTPTGRSITQRIALGCNFVTYSIPFYFTAQIVSIFFMIMLIIVYMLLPNFKSIHGKCCICYFRCLTVLVFNWTDTSHGIACKLFGYAGYYAVLVTFCWLSVINYNLWKTFNNIGVGQKVRFARYNIIVWSAAAVLVLVIFLFDYLHEFMGIPINLIPGIGLYTCWINTFCWSAMIYYFGPILLLLLLNITLLIKTTNRIVVQNRGNRRVLKLSDGQRNFRNLTK
ncbi:probable G-protein coupled receptor Mth-like 11 [Drosophila navojoa]|uniref:probable G-protein coupled receptor Mth-like 11 n=1 Tax=Drosophila navojoa TaxID=7232 RepID=UPI0011BEDACB|nr:probable G-protein coupled receptor Mth-like 11 [Drosophila navojoa]